ncbi:hypothetical protein [Leucothrix mucor]|uniref:hypothetical protein n=1 Tax=Leucothrix mucor TaxID=45248 RepID=UPI0012F96E28|nr:hypothetical protein [Leucothrix mucor]
MFSSKHSFYLAKLLITFLMLFPPATELNLGDNLIFRTSGWGVNAETEPTLPRAAEPTYTFTNTNEESDSSSFGAGKAKSEAPKSEVPQSEVPQSEVPQSEVPQSEVPQSEAPQSEAPQSEVPQSEAPLFDTISFVLRLLVLCLSIVFVILSWGSIKNKLNGFLGRRGGVRNLRDTSGGVINNKNEFSDAENITFIKLQQEISELKRSNTVLSSKVDDLSESLSKTNIKKRLAEEYNENLLNKMRRFYDNEGVSSLGVELSLLSVQKGNSGGEGLYGLIRSLEEIDRALLDTSKHISVVTEQLTDLGANLLPFLEEIGYSQIEIPDAIDGLVGEIHAKSKFHFELEFPLVGTSVNLKSMSVKGDGVKVGLVSNWAVLYDNEYIVKAVVNSK